MAKLVPYLCFAGDCREAHDFHATAGVGRVERIVHSGDTADAPAWVMNARLVGDGFDCWHPTRSMLK